MDDRFPGDGRPWTSERTGAACTYYLGEGDNDLEVVVTDHDGRPRKSWLQNTWRDRRDGRAVPVLLLVAHETSDGEVVTLCGPTGEEPTVTRSVDPAQARRVAVAGLSRDSGVAAQQFLRQATDKLSDDLVGVTNQGLLATHELRAGVPRRDDWNAATAEARPLLDRSGQDLVRGLGYEIERGDGDEFVLTRGPSGHRQAVAVFVDDGVAFDQPTERFGDTPVGYALNAARRHNLDYVVASDGDRLRLYTRHPEERFGSRGRTDTFVEVDTSLLAPSRAGYLWLLFSSDALRENGTLAEIQRDSEDYASDLSDRLRERIYDDVVPDLAEAISAARDVDDPDREQLDETYEMTLYLLYRLLFVAYAEDERHLPRYVEGYDRRSLKETAKELHRIVEDDGFAFDETATAYWDDLTRLFAAIHDGQPAWGLPAYDGTLLSSSEGVGARLDDIQLTDAVFAPILHTLLVDETPDDGADDGRAAGPVDFRDIGVREFGVIYEGLLESELSQADRDLRLDDDDQYVPADDDTPDDDVAVAAGEVYLHGLSGERKATGTYYTKSTFVEHLLDHSLEPALEAHLAELDAMDDADAAANFFDFRVADVAMGSGHFLVGAVDRIERAFSDYLAERSLPRVESELDGLRQEALSKFEHTDADPEIERDQVLRRQIARRCVYGVDLNPLATELARLSLWIHTFVPGLPLTFLDYNLRTGDALAGVGTLEEVSDEIGTDAAQVSLGSFDPEGGPDLLAEIESKIAELGEYADASAEEVAEARALREEIESRLSGVDDRFDVLAAARIDDDDRVDTSVAGDQHVDDVTTTPSYEAAQELLASVDAFHFPTAFPEVFVGEDPGFDCLVGNPPWEEATLEEDEFWTRYEPGLQREESHGGDKDEIVAELREERPDLVEKYDRESEEIETRRKILAGGPFPGMGAGDPDTYKGFSWRFWRLARDRGHVGVVLPRGAFIAAGSEEFRRNVMENGVVTDLTFLKNRGEWVFDGVGSRFTIGLLSFEKSQPEDDETLPLRGPFPDDQSYRQGVEAGPYELSAAEATEWTGSAGFPMLPSDPRSVGVFKQLTTKPPLDLDEPNEWRARPYAELHETNDKTKDDGTQLIHQTDEPPAEDYWPVLDGGSINPSDDQRWIMDTGSRFGWGDPEVMLEYLQEQRKNSYVYAGSRSGFSEFSEEWVNDPDTLPCLDYRIAFRDVTQRTNTRTVLASLIPPERFLTNKAPYFLWPRGDERDEAYLLGVLNSIPLDWYARRFVEINLNYHILNSFPIPRPGREDTLRERVEAISGRLASQSDDYADWADAVGVDCGPLPDDEQTALIHELDAVVAHLYGLSREHVEVIFETFHDNWDHRERLTAVLEWYEEWEGRLSAE